MTQHSYYLQLLMQSSTLGASWLEHRYIPHDINSGSLRIFIIPEYRSQGFAFEASKIVLKFAFGFHHITHVSSSISPPAITQVPRQQTQPPHGGLVTYSIYTTTTTSSNGGTHKYHPPILNNVVTYLSTLSPRPSLPEKLGMSNYGSDASYTRWELSSEEFKERWVV